MNHQIRQFAVIGILVGLILVQACGRRLPEERSCGFVQNSEKRRVSWTGDFPVELYLDSSVPSEYVTAVQAAIDHWNFIGQSLMKQDFFRLRGTSPGSHEPRVDGYSTIYVLHTWDAKKDTEQARTTIHWTGSRIYEADIRVNALNFEYSTSSAAEPTSVHLQSLLIHELGHVLGLAHNGSQESVMQPSLANGKVRTDINSVDYSSLKCEY